MEDVQRSKRVCPWCRQPIGQVVVLDKSEAPQLYRVTHLSCEYLSRVGE